MTGSIPITHAVVIRDEEMIIVLVVGLHEAAIPQRWRADRMLHTLADDHDVLESWYVVALAPITIVVVSAPTITVVIYK